MAFHERSTFVAVVAVATSPVGAVPTTTVTMALLGKAGIPADQSHFVAVGAGNTFIAAMQQGRIDAARTEYERVAASEREGPIRSAARQRLAALRR